MDLRRCTDSQFFINPSIHHRDILLLCLNLMRERLERNICRLEDYTILGEVKDLPDHQKEHIGDALEYACCFWTKHLLGIPDGSSGVDEVQKAIDNSFTTCLLFWIEALILMGKLDIAVYALNDIQHWYTLVSYMWRNSSENLYLHLFRQEICASGWMTASTSSWSTLIQSATPLPRYTILPSHSVLLHLGFMSTMLQSSHKRLGW